MLFIFEVNKVQLFDNLQKLRYCCLLFWNKLSSWGSCNSYTINTVNVIQVTSGEQSLVFLFFPQPLNFLTKFEVYHTSDQLLRLLKRRRAAHALKKLSPKGAWNLSSRCYVIHYFDDTVTDLFSWYVFICAKFIIG